jgi:hypothetical protein
MMTSSGPHCQLKGLIHVLAPFTTGPAPSAANHPNGGAVIGFELPPVPAPGTGGHTA